MLSLLNVFVLRLACWLTIISKFTLSLDDFFFSLLISLLWAVGGSLCYELILAITQAVSLSLSVLSVVISKFALLIPHCVVCELPP